MEIKRIGQRKFLRLSWRDIEVYADALESRISDDGYDVDVIVGVLRGGVFLAELLSDLMNVREVYVVGCRSYTGLSASEVKIYHDLQLSDLSGRSVLLVDDIADTGNTLETAVKNIIIPRRPGKLKTAAPLIKPWSRVKPDYYVDSTDAWVIFPWERAETVRSLGRFFLETLGPERGLMELSSVSGLSDAKINSILLTV